MPSILERQRERFLADPTDRRAFEALEEAHFVEANWDDLVRLYTQRLTAPDLERDPRECARVWFRLGQVWDERCEQLERATECYRAAVEVDPGCRPALAALRRASIVRGQWDVALQIAEAELGLEMATGERAKLLAEVGSIWFDQLDDAEQARLHFERALEQDPDAPVALEGAARACHRLGHPREAAELWARRAASARGAERARALVHRAGLLTGALGDPSGGAELYRRALTDDPQNLDALEALAAIAESQRQWTLLAELHERRFLAAPDPERRAAVALAAGRVHQHQLGDLELAAVWLARAAEQGTRDPLVPRALADLARERGDEAMLRDALVRELQLADGEPGVGVLVELAALHSEADDEPLACELLERAVAQAPQDALVVEALSESLARLQRFDELADCLERRAELAAADPAIRAGVLAELAAVQQSHLDDPDAARRSYERAFETDPASPEVARELERIYRKAEAWEQLRALLEQIGNKGPGELRIRSFCSLGELLSRQFDDPAGAARAFEAALALDRECAAAHRGLQQLASDGGDTEGLLASCQAEAAVTTDASRLGVLARELARLLVERGRIDEAWPGVARWIEQAPEDADALQLGARLLEDLGRDEELLGLLERLDPRLAGAEQAACRRRRAEAHRRAGRREACVDAYREALAADPDDATSLEALAELLEETAPAGELADVLARLGERIDGPPRAAALERLAQLREERLGDVAGAIDALGTLGTLEPDREDVALRLEQLLERSARHEELAEHLARRAGRAEPREARRLALRRAGILLQELSRFGEAASVYREILTREPDCDEAREGLERALRAAGEPEALAEFLAEQSHSHPDPSRRDACALERAVILDEVMGRREAAIEICREVAGRAHDPADRARARQRVTALLEREGDWAGLRAHWEGCLEIATPGERCAMHERTARLCRERLHDADGARAHLEAAAALAPERADLWRQLASLHEAANRVEDWVDALEAELRTGPPEERELELRRRAAALAIDPLDDAPRAHAHYERIAALDPGDGMACEALIQRAEEQERPDEVVRLLEGRLIASDALPRDDASDWAAERTALRLRIAGLRSGPLDDPDGAIAILEPGLAEIGPRAAVAEPLADLYERTGYADELIELCGRAAGAAEPGSERAAWLSRHGDALRRRGRDREAADAYRDALDESPGDTETRAALREVYRRLGEAGPLVHLLESELAGLSGPDEIPIRAELARLLSGPLCLPAEALVQLRRIVEIDPGHADAVQLGLALAEDEERTDVVRELLDTALSRPLAASARAELLVRRGALGASDPAGVFEAAADFREALSLDPRLEAARDALRRLLETTGQWEAALACRFEQAQSAPAEARTGLLERGADLAWEQLSPEAALPWLERLRRALPDHVAVVARIAEIHRLAGRPRARLRALEDQLSLTHDAAARRDLQLERARLLERELDSPARAVAAIEEARRQCPDDLELLRQLDRLYRHLERPRERSGILESLAERGPDRDRVSLLCEAAQLHLDTLAEPERAAELLLRAVAEAPAQGALRAELLRSLGEAWRRAGNRDAWSRSAEAELAALDPEAEVFAERRRELRRQLAEAHREAGRLDGAVRHLRVLVDRAPDGTPAEDTEAALLDALRRQSSWVELERRLAARLTRRGGSAEQWLELARLRAEHLAAPGAASVAYRGALEEDPACLPALRGLRDVAERSGDWEQVAATLDGELGHAGERAPVERAALLRRLGDVCWRRLGSTTRASRAYAAALEACPEDFAAHRALERLLEAMEDWRGALDLYESEIEVLGQREPARRQAAWLRAGEIARDQLGEIERALRAYVAAAAISELPVERRAEHAELHRRCGELAAFAEVFASWCDDPDAPARSGDHLRLARTLEELDRLDEALARAERALELDPGDGAAWDLLARGREQRGDDTGAAHAWERAASCAHDGGAAARLLSAARLSTDTDRAGAAELLRRAAAADPAARDVQCALAQVAFELEAFEESERAAARVLELEGADPEGLDDATRLATALCGARAARALGRTEAACRFYGAALDEAPDAAEALAGAGETRAALGDLPAARRALERLLELDDEATRPDQGVHRALLARCLEAAGENAAALAQCEAALEADPDQAEAYELAARIHEEADRLEAGVDLLERWAQRGPGPARARRLLRAAEWELRHEHTPAAEAHLRDALEADPELPGAWDRLATLLWSTGRGAEALELATSGLEVAREEPAVRASLAGVRARALEEAGEREAAAEAWGDVASADPRCVEAAIARARLLRAGGDWRGAAEALEGFAQRHPGDDPTGLAEVLQQLGRLLAGPLEDLERAIEVYRRAVDLDPEHAELRVALAELLTHRSSHWMEALAEHGQVLESEPLRVASLRAVLGIAREHGGEHGAAMGLALLRALGEATALELQDAPEALPLAIARKPRLEDPVGESVRRVVVQLAAEIAEALGAPGEPPDTAPTADGPSAFRAAALAAQAELAAPGLAPLTVGELGELLRCVARLVTETEPEEVSGATLNALSQALGRRARRRARRVLGDVAPAQVDALDVADWRAELRALAAAAAVDATGGDLRAALVARVCERLDRSTREISETTQLTPLVAAVPEAVELVRRAVRTWLAELRP